MNFTMNGYHDLDTLTDGLRDEGITFEHCRTREQQRAVVAIVCREILRAIEGMPTDGAERALYAGVSGIVSCAEEDELL